MHGDVKDVNNGKPMPDLARDALQKKLCSIQDWILGPGEILLNSQRLKPYSYKEAMDMRKEHEQIEFKCMKALENFASVCEYRKQNVPNAALDTVERLVQNYIDRLNKRTFFVVTCHSYFRSAEELWRLLEEVYRRSQEVDMYDSVSIRDAIEEIETGLQKCDSRLSVLAHELERLKVILNSSDPMYLAHLEECYAEVFKTAGERIQDMRIRKLVLKKHSKLLECEENVHESVGWIEELLENIELLYRENCVGKNQLEASDLHSKCSDIYKQAKTTYTYSTQIMETYAKLCEADGRKLPRNVSLSRTRLNRIWPRLEDRLREFQDRTATAESMYTQVDLLLNRVQEYLLEVIRNPPAIDRVSEVHTGMIARVTPKPLLHGKLDDLTHQFQEVKSLGLQLITRLPKGLLAEDPPFVGTISDEVAYLIRLKLYTLWLKLRDFECAVLGHNANDNTFAAELGLEHGTSLDPLCGRSDLITKWKLSEQIKVGSLPLLRAQSSPSSPPQFAQRHSEHSPIKSHQSFNGNLFPPLMVSVPAETKIQPAGDARSSSYSGRFDESIEPARGIQIAFDQFQSRFSELVTNVTPPVDDATVELTKRAIELELQRFENRLDLSLSNTLDKKSTNLMDLVNHARIKAKHLCEQWWRQWDRSGAQFPVGGDPSQEKLLELESDLCECQTRLLDLVNAVCLTTAQAARSMTMIDSSDNQQQGSNVFLEVISTSDMERVLMIAEETRGMIQTIPDQERFIERTILEVECAPHLKWNVLSVKNLWQAYQEKLTCFEKFITSLEHGFKLLSQIKKFTVQKDVYFNNLEAHQTRFPELQAEGHRIEQAILTLVDPDRLCPLAERVESLLEVKPRVGWLVLRLQTALKEIRNDIDEADMLFSNLRACGPVGKVTPKRSQSDSFHRVSGIPRELSAQSLRTSSPLSPNGVPSMSSLDDSKRLDVQDLAVLESTPPPLPPRATTALFQTSDGASGRSRRTESSQASNGWETKSFDSIPAAWRITHPLRDLRVNTGERLSLTCQFTGPSGQNSFSTKWIFRPFVYALGREADLGPEVDILATDNSVSQESGLDYARLLFKSIVPKLAGIYSVHIVSSATGRELTCSARVHVLPHLLSPLANLTVATADAQTGRLEPVAFTVAYRGFTQIPHALWTHAGHPVDSTIWRMSTNLDSSTIFSSVAERSSQGQYECRLHDPQTGFELCSSGILSVCDQLEFIEPLHPQRVVNGQPFRLSCRITCPEGYCLCSSANFEHTSETTEPRVLWLLNGHELTAVDSSRLGITTEVDGDILTLNVPNARPQHSGLYQCEVKVGNVTARTQCKVVVEDAIAPKILACSVEPPGTVFEGQTVNISVRFEGHPLPSCSWIKDDKPVVVNETHWEGCKLTICADRCTFMIPHVRLEHTGVYQVTLSNCLGTDVASAMLLLAASSSSRRPSSSTTLSGKNVSTRTDVHTLDPIPNLILLHPKCTVASVGERVRFVCIIDASSGPASVGWSHDGRNLTSQAGCRIFNNHPREGIFHLELECVQKRDAGDYCANAVRVDAKHGTGSTEKSEFELKLLESSNLEFPPKAPYCDDATPHSIIRVVSGESVTLSFSVYAYPEPEFCWIRNKKEMVGHSCERYKITHKGILYCLTIENVSLKDSGLWELVCYNSAGVLISSNQLEVISPVSEKSGGSARSVTTKLVESTVFLPDSSSTPADASMALASSTSSTTLSERKALVSHPISVDTGGTQPPEFKSVFTDITCRTGDTVRLTARLTGCPSPLVCWAFNGESIQNTNDRYRVLHHGEVYSLWIEDVRVTDSGRYSLTAENIVGLATCSALLFVSAGSISRPYSPLSDPGFCIHSADGAADGFAPERRLLRQHSGTQTPTHQRVALIRSISTSHLDDEFFELANPYSDYAHCHRCSSRKRYVCNHQPIEQPRIKSAGSNVTGKRHRGVHGRIRGRISGLSETESPWRFSRHGSEGSLVHICPSCHSIMKSRAAYEDGDSDDGCILSTHITERIYTRERNRNDNLSSSHNHMRARCGQPGDSLPDPPRYHHSFTQSRPSDPSPTQREIPIQFMNRNSSSYVQEQSHRERFSHDRVLPVAATRTRNLPVSTPISAPADPQFSTVESSDGEVNQ